VVTVLGCITEKHNVWLVLVAGLLCAVGSWVTARLFQRTVGTAGMQKLGWHVLTAISAGVAIWCTHFVAMRHFMQTQVVHFPMPLIRDGCRFCFYVFGSLCLFSYRGVQGGAKSYPQAARSRTANARNV